jgi:hypothetical protein
LLLELFSLFGSSEDILFCLVKTVKFEVDVQDGSSLDLCETVKTVDVTIGGGVAKVEASWVSYLGRGSWLLLVVEDLLGVKGASFIEVSLLVGVVVVFVDDKLLYFSFRWEFWSFTLAVVVYHVDYDIIFREGWFWLG